MTFQVKIAQQGSLEIIYDPGRKICAKNNFLITSGQ